MLAAPAPAEPLEEVRQRLDQTRTADAEKVRAIAERTQRNHRQAWRQYCSFEIYWAGWRRDANGTWFTNKQPIRIDFLIERVVIDRCSTADSLCSPTRPVRRLAPLGSTTRRSVAHVVNADHRSSR